MEKTGNVVGNVTIDNGTGDATVTINDKPAATDTVGGDLTIKNSAGETTFNTKAATFAGKVTVETHSVATAKIDGAMIGGNLSLTSGDGWDTIQILNSAVTGKTTIKTGDGNDVVDIERSASAAPPSTFTGFAYINTGDGDDKVNVGTGVGNGAANFNGGLTIDGGPGLDTLLVVLPGSTTDGGATFAPKLISIA